MNRSRSAETTDAAILRIAGEVSSEMVDGAHKVVAIGLLYDAFFTLPDEYARRMKLLRGAYKALLNAERRPAVAVA